MGHNLVRYLRKDLREGDDLSGLKAFGTLLDGEFHFFVPARAVCSPPC
jgi:hypothetical protein